jgi:hypothetical protein
MTPIRVRCTVLNDLSEHEERIGVSSVGIVHRREVPPYGRCSGLVLQMVIDPEVQALIIGTTRYLARSAVDPVGLTKEVHQPMGIRIARSSVVEMRAKDPSTPVQHDVDVRPFFPVDVVWCPVCCPEYSAPNRWIARDVRNGRCYGRIERHGDLLGRVAFQF